MGASGGVGRSGGEMGEAARGRALARLRESLARLERLRRDGLANGNHALVAFAEELLIKYEELAFRIERGSPYPAGHANGANGHGPLPPQRLM